MGRREGRPMGQPGCGVAFVSSLTTCLPLVAEPASVGSTHRTRRLRPSDGLPASVDRYDGLGVLEYQIQPTGSPDGRGRRVSSGSGTTFLRQCSAVWRCRIHTTSHRLTQGKRHTPRRFEMMGDGSCCIKSIYVELLGRLGEAETCSDSTNSYSSLRRPSWGSHIAPGAR
jgi:hypothetical protein